MEVNVSSLLSEIKQQQQREGRDMLSRKFSQINFADKASNLQLQASKVTKDRVQSALTAKVRPRATLPQQR
jgi:hypothetical protein